MKPNALLASAKFSALSVAILVGTELPAQSQSPNGSLGVGASMAASAARADAPPSIDGMDRDHVWHLAPAMTDFRVYDPTVNGSPSMRTEARFAYDEARMRTALERAGLAVETLEVEREVQRFASVEEALAAAVGLEERWRADGRWFRYIDFLEEGGRTLTRSHLIAKARRP